MRVSDRTPDEIAERAAAVRTVTAQLACATAGVDVAAVNAATGPDAPRGERRALLVPLLPVAEQWVEVVAMLTGEPRGGSGEGICRCGCDQPLTLMEIGSATGYKSHCAVRARRGR
jgi:hypothetical protein